MEQMSKNRIAKVAAVAEIVEKLKSYFTKKKDQAEVLVEDESGDTIEINITKENYTELVENSARPVLLDFWAPWCGPCRMVAPIVEEIAAERSDMVLGKINVDEEMELAMKFGIASIPTLIVIKDGKEAGKLIGYRPKADIEKLLG